jgi:hypothetical protein
MWLSSSNQSSDKVLLSINNNVVLHRCNFHEKLIECRRRDVVTRYEPQSLSIFYLRKMK